MQYLNKDLVNQILKLIIIDTHIFTLKIASCIRIVGKIWSRGTLFFKMWQFQLYGVC